MLIICVALSITTLAVFWQVGNHEFISFDDNDYVTENRYVQDGITLKGIVWAFSEPHAHNWHPLTWLSHMLDCQVFGLEAGAASSGQSLLSCSQYSLALSDFPPHDKGSLAERLCGRAFCAASPPCGVCRLGG